MPVQRFRKHEQAREALWGEPGDPEYLRQIAWLWGFADHIARRSHPRGVQRFRSIEEANRARDRWETRAHDA